MQGMPVHRPAKALRTSVLVLLLLLSFTVPAGAVVDQPSVDAVYYVSASGSPDANCGSQAKPCRTIQQAVNLAAAGKETEIRVAQGVYTGEGENVVDIRLLTPGRSITIVGGYVAGSWRIPDLNPGRTIIDAQTVRRGIKVESIAGTGSIAQKIALRNLTVQDGRVTRRLEAGDPKLHWTAGGGLLCLNNNAGGTIALDITNVVFRNNRVQGEPSNGLAAGGGMALMYGCPASLTNVTLSNNTVVGGNAADGSRGAQAVGGGLYAGRDSHIVGNRVVFRENRVTGGNGGSGRTPDNWTPDGLGGGASFQYNNNVLANVEVVGNVATGGNANDAGGIGSGGGLFFEYATVEVRDGIISGNRAVGGNSPGRSGIASGGGLMATDAEVRLERLSIVQNKAQGGSGGQAGQSGGGGLYFTKAQPSHIMNVTGANLIIANNETDPGSGQNPYGGGGGIFSQDTRMSLNHVTLDNNRIASEQTGVAAVVLHNFSGPNASVLNLSNSIVSNHQHRWAASIMIQRNGDVGNISRTLFHANRQDGGQDVHQFPGAPAPVINITGRLSGNPHYLDPAVNDYRLTHRSAAIDVGSASSERFDFEGQERPLGAAPDVGADEFGPIELNISLRPDFLQMAWDADWELIPDADKLVLAYGRNRFDRFIVLDHTKGGQTLTNIEEIGNSKARLEIRDRAGAVLVASNEIQFFVPVSVQFLSSVQKD